MSFSTVSEAYNAYRNTPLKTLEARCTAINASIAGDANADISAFMTELEAIESVIEERRQGGTAIIPDLAHTAQSAEAENKASLPEYRSAFYKHLQGRELTTAERSVFEAVIAEQRSSEFNTLSNSGAVIPTTTLNEIIVKAREQGGFLADARAFAMPSGIRIPVATPGQPASWHTEGDTVESEKASVAHVSFNAYEVMRLLSISAATKSMSISAFETYVVDELSSSIMAALAKGAIDGTGSGEAEGVLEGVTWVTSGEGKNNVEIAAGEELAYSDLLEVVALLKRGYARGAKFYCSNETLYRSIYALHDEVARPVYLESLTADGPGRILGFPVEVDDYLPADTILFGNARYYGWNLPSGIALDMSRESSFAKGLVDYRGLAVADGKVIVPEAFTRITKAEA